MTNPSDYYIPESWVPNRGGLFQNSMLCLLNEGERMILFNQDVVYHQNLQIFDILKKLEPSHRPTPEEAPPDIVEKSVVPSTGSSKKEPIKQIPMEVARLSATKLMVPLPNWANNHLQQPPSNENGTGTTGTQLSALGLLEKDRNTKDSKLLFESSLEDTFGTTDPIKFGEYRSHFDKKRKVGDVDDLAALSKKVKIIVNLPDAAVEIKI